jgi:6-phosphogluconolactonase
MLTNRIVKWVAVFLLIAQIAISKENVLDVYFGTMGRAAEGIYRTQFLTDTGRFRSAQLVAQVQSPNFLTQHPNDAILYAVCKGERAPSIIAYKIKKDGTLHEFSRMDSPQGLACHVCVHPSGRFLLTAHYSAGAISAFPLDERGKIGQPKVYAHSGSSGIVAKRQASVHPHWTGFSPDGRYALIPDLGLDQIIIYKVEIGVELLSKHAIAETDPGAGPRHMRFSNNGKFIYLLNELQSSVTVFSWDADTGTCRRIASYETLS